MPREVTRVGAYALKRTLGRGRVRVGEARGAGQDGRQGGDQGASTRADGWMDASTNETNDDDDDDATADARDARIATSTESRRPRLTGIDDRATRRA